MGCDVQRKHDIVIIRFYILQLGAQSMTLVGINERSCESQVITEGVKRRGMGGQVYCYLNSLINMQLFPFLSTENYGCWP